MLTHWLKLNYSMFNDVLLNITKIQWDVLFDLCSFFLQNVWIHLDDFFVL